MADNESFKDLKEFKRLGQERKQKALSLITEKEWQDANARLEELRVSGKLPKRTHNRRSFESYCNEL